MREFTKVLMRRMGGSFWTFLACLAPVAIHAADHLVVHPIARARGIAFFDIGIDGFLAQRYGVGAGQLYHDVMVALGGISILLLMWVVVHPRDGRAVA